MNNSSQIFQWESLCLSLINKITKYILNSASLIIYPQYSDYSSAQPLCIVIQIVVYLIH